MTANKVYKVASKGLNKYLQVVKLIEFNGLYNVTEVRENYKLGRMIKATVIHFKADTSLEIATKKYNHLIK